MFPTPDHKPAEGLPPDIRRVLLGTDLGHTSELATDRGFDLAQRHGADLLVVSVIDPGDLRPPAGPVGIRWDQVRDGRHDAAKALVARGRAIRVAVGTHGRGTIGRLLLGSVSDRVVRSAPCPVLVVPPHPAGRISPRLRESQRGSQRGLITVRDMGPVSSSGSRSQGTECRQRADD